MVKEPIQPGDSMGTLDVRHLSKAYTSGAERLVVLDGLSLHLQLGDNIAVMGPSGSGKSTLLHILGTLETPSGGSIIVDGIDPFRLKAKELAQFRQTKVGFIFQDHHLLPQLSLIDNLLLPAMASGRILKAHVQRAHDLLERIGLQDRRNHLPSELSGGERERTAVVRALMMKPTLLLADEPTGNLDQSNANKVADMLLELQRDEPTILIVVTHSQDLASRMQRRFYLRNGRLVEETT